MKKYDVESEDNMANLGKQTIGIISSIIVIVAIMAIKFVGINMLVHFFKFW
jgi:hypothetical protein